jgi:hypothetical protein
MKNRSILAISIVFTPFLASLCVPLSASANGWERASKIDHGLIAATPKTDLTVPVSFGGQGDDAIRPAAPGNARIGNTDTGVKPITPGNQQSGVDDSIRPIAPGSQRIGTDDSIKPIKSKPVTPSAKRTGQDDDSI